MAGTDAVEQVAKWLVVIGGINWGLVGVGSFAGQNLNVVKLIFSAVPGAGALLENIVYVLVGLSALWMLKGQFAK